MMSSKDARAIIAEHEKKINDNYRSLRTSVSDVGVRAVKAASTKTLLCYLIPLSVSLFGMLLCGLHHWFWGILHIGLGIFLCVKIGNSAKDAQNRVESRRNELERSISNR